MGNPGPSLTSTVQARERLAGRAAIVRLIRRLADRTGLAARRTARAPGPDNVHELRVATRRLRAVLDTFREELNPRLYAELKFDLKNLTRETGALRDADVQRALLMPIILGTPEITPEIRRDCAISLEQARSDARAQLRARMRATPWLARLARIRAAARDPDLVAARTEPLADFIGVALGRHLAGLRRRLGRRRFGARRLHRLRLRIRSARYAAESTLPLLKQRSAPLATTLQRLQDQLGAAHDLSEARRLLAGGLLPERIGAAFAAALAIDAERQQRRCRRKLRALAKDPPAEWQAFTDAIRQMTRA